MTMTSPTLPVILLGLATLGFACVALAKTKLASALKGELRRAADDAARTRGQLAAEQRERKDAEQALINSCDFAETVLNSTRDAVSIIESGTYRIINVNSVFEREYGLSREQIIGRTCYEITHRRSSPCSSPHDHCPLMKTVESGEPAEFIHEHLREDGGTRYVEVSTYPVRNKSGLVVHLSRDITERKTAERDLETAHRAMSLTFAEIERERSALGDALDEISMLIQRVVTERDLSIRFSNPHLRKCHEVMSCATKSCPCFGKEAARCWQVAGTYCGRAPQGTFAVKLTSCVECSVFRFATDDPIYQIGEHFNNMMHMLELKNNELRETSEELKTAQLQMLQQEKMASVGQLAAGIAHEINNPTGFIISNLGSLRKYTVKLSEFIKVQAAAIDALAGGAADAGRVIGEVEAGKRSLKIGPILDDLGGLINESIDGAERVKKIVQNLKSFSRLDESEQRPADLNAGLESTIAIVWNELKYKAAVVREYGDIPLTKCNLGQLNQVFMNLLVNAAQAIEKQGEIAVRTRRQNGGISVSVSDTGCGIPPENLSKVFNPFFTTKEVGKGTGLGLSIAYDIVRKHNGELTVESEVNKGTTFTVKIPVVEG